MVFSEGLWARGIVSGWGAIVEPSGRHGLAGYFPCGVAPFGVCPETGMPPVFGKEGKIVRTYRGRPSLWGLPPWRCGGDGGEGRGDPLPAGEGEG